MRVLLVQPFGERRGHFGLYATKIAQELAGLGHDVTLLTSRLDPTKYISDPVRFRLVETGIYNRYLAQGAPGSMVPQLVEHFIAVVRNNFHVLATALHEAKVARFDVLHILDFEPLSSWLLFTMTKLREGAKLPPVIMVLHPADFTFKLYRNEPIRAVYKEICRLMLKNLLGTTCRRIVVHTKWHQERIKEQLGIDVENENESLILVIPYPTDLPRIRIDKSAARAQIGVKYDGTIFLFFGMIRKDKGIETLLEAVPRVDGEFRLLIVGAPTHYSAEELRRKMEVTSRADKIVAKLEYVSEEEMGYYFYAADAVILPYTRRYVGGAGPLVTACGYGLPVIATQVAEMGLLFDEFQIGIPVPPEEPDALAKAMSEFIALDGASRQRMSEQARILAATRSWRAMAERLGRVYASVS